jgi:phosphohistidine phosphatase
MRLYLIRHAEAFPLGLNGIDKDEDRPLTENGRSQCRALAACLNQLGVKLEKVITSPLVRARQTVDELLAQWGGPVPAVEESEYLAPGSKKRKLLRDVLASGGEAIALVGHNPDLSELLAWLIGDREIGVSMSKAGVACINFDGPPIKGAGALVWLVTPAWYRLAAPVS